MSAPSAATFELPLSEQQVLGSALHGDLSGLDMLTAADFTCPRRRAIAETIWRLRAEGSPVDPAAVVAALVGSPEVRWTAGKSVGVHVADLVEATAVVASGAYHAKRVTEASARRQMAAMAGRVTETAATAPLDVALSRIEAMVAELGPAVRRVTG